MDSFPALPSLSSVLDETRDHHTGAFHYISLLLSHDHTSLRRTCMHTSRCPLAFGFLGPRCSSLLSHILLASLSSLSCFTQSWVIIRVFGFRLCPFSCLVLFYRLFPTLNVSTRTRRRKKYCINVHCILPPSRFPSFHLHPSFSLFLFFYCDNSSLPCTVEQSVSLFMHTFCKWPSFLSPPFTPLGFSLGRI